MKTLRQDAGLSQSELARALDIAESTVRNWDQGRSIPTLSALEYPHLLKLLNCSPEELANAAAQSKILFEQKQAAKGKKGSGSS
ncbi:helix-turn-helix domain-containing protein [Acaryochloris marina]|uniref:HTH cro/C1-type domain-containing protein n=1 Tax=Acaryochloris marina (strain MBIC 11017) TaxID=329726 RepID=A8ZKZ8_ACAM1|nr:helix-turn-helix transcriptional regulator [Acaryochloris marina]ABW31466.1 conserved hypothetical protein [Acaryochloris marina MBIC11017]